MKRRNFLKSTAALTGLTYTGITIPFMPQNLLAAKLGKANKTLVVIFQRGAADALSMFSPMGDKHYNKEMRPNLYIPADQMLKADSYFSFHPALTGFKSLWDKGLLTAVPLVGSPSNTRSHFDAQDYFESGTPDIKSTDTGFLSRASEGFVNYEQQKISALSVQPGLARMISGGVKSLSFSELSRFSIQGLGSLSSKNAKGFEDFFDEALDEVIKGRTQNSTDMLQAFAQAGKIQLQQQWGSLKRNQLGNRLQDVAKIIKADMDIPVIVTEMGGWDTHNNQGGAQGQLAGKLKDFSDSITMFVNELGPKINDVTIVTVSEFGRTVNENGSRGTDHGHGSCYFVINGKLKPKNIAGQWKDLKNENLYDGRDLPVTTDFREVFHEIISHEFAIKNFDQIFPNWKSKDKLKLFKV